LACRPRAMPSISACAFPAVIASPAIRTAPLRAGFRGLVGHRPGRWERHRPTH
jgi:hypothetical protein